MSLASFFFFSFVHLECSLFYCLVNIEEHFGRVCLV